MEFLSSWKTAALGIGLILTGIGGALVALLDGDPETAVNIEATAAAIMAGIALIFARDADKHDENNDNK